MKNLVRGQRVALPGSKEGTYHGWYEDYWGEIFMMVAFDEDPHRLIGYSPTWVEPLKEPTPSE